VKAKHPPYPKVLKTFRKLEGGKFGYLDIIARNRATLEFALGDDFVRFSRENAYVMANVVADWLEETKEDEAPSREETEFVVVETTERVEAPRPRSRGRRADAE
jgi:hypothetical protein